MGGGGYLSHAGKRYEEEEEKEEPKIDLVQGRCATLQTLRPSLNSAQRIRKDPDDRVLSNRVVPLPRSSRGARSLPAGSKSLHP